jgi:hypothetical protein
MCNFNQILINVIESLDQHGDLVITKQQVCIVVMLICVEGVKERVFYFKNNKSCKHNDARQHREKKLACNWFINTDDSRVPSWRQSTREPSVKISIISESWLNQRKQLV